MIDIATRLFKTAPSFLLCFQSFSERVLRPLTQVLDFTSHVDVSNY